VNTLTGWQIAMIIFALWAVPQLWKKVLWVRATTPIEDPRLRLPEDFFDEGGGDL